jgi:putative membrane protein
MKLFLQRWLISTVAVLVATHIVPGIHYREWYDLLITTLVLGILNTFVRPIMVILSLPLVVLTLGLFTLVINALLLMFVSFLMRPAFVVTGFGQALLGALVIFLISLALQAITGIGSVNVEVRRGKPGKKPNDDDGPVIDV